MIYRSTKEIDRTHNNKTQYMVILKMYKILLIIGFTTFFSTPTVGQELKLDFEPAATLIGIAKVKDGDGVLFGKVEVRLQGVAAPEDNKKRLEKGGVESTKNLQLFVSGKQLKCYLDGTRARHRPVGVCFLNGIDIGKYQVAAGHARDCPRFSKGRYATTEAEARSKGRNLSDIYTLPKYCHPKKQKRKNTL